MENQIKNILKRGNTENAGIESRQEMLSLFHQPEIEYALKDELVKELEGWNASEASSPNLKKIFANIWTTIKKQERQKKAKIRYLNMGMRIAAALVIGLLLGVFVTSRVTREAPVFYTAHSPLGSVSELELPDGTTIFLNSGSDIKYSVNSKRNPREVFLDGEAWFQVERDKKRPFVVHTPLYNVQVTGTKFNVKAYKSENRVTTTLEEGEVVISSDKNSQINRDFVLNPGQQLALSGGSGKPEIQQVNPKWFTAWKDNKLILVNMPLKELIVLLERKYGVEFVIKDDSVLNYHCDAAFQGESLIELMDILKKMIAIDYKVVGQTIEITTSETSKKEGK
ncbi:FecR family protein [Mariniphaga anaerophila]|uniref:FecR family protein n=1 Tax=Mariniphaga anaerophila TaxID=1484053 RepID=A0A1M5BA79_9BACT|nr:FecR family protein [Mariniphaga anaerophila]SHF39340.1 FecR family protein [Mariniphaga anaerophila]